MPKYISTHAKLLVVSDTGMFQNDNGHTYAFGPVARELNYLLEVFSQITWIGFNREDQKGNASYVRINQPQIKPILLDHVGGPTLRDKLGIIERYPKMYSIINDALKSHDYIHSRVPSNPAVIAAYLSKRYPKKQFWFKYAGNWKGVASRSYKFQRKLLKGLKDNSIVTVNGNWPNQKTHIIGFENPCLDEDDRALGKTVVSEKHISENIHYCFVGNLDDNKGVKQVLQAFINCKNKALGTLHIVGKGTLEYQLKTMAKDAAHDIVFHGFLNKYDLAKIYTQSHFIVLPSKSEGFPKVIGEAMNYGCIPIVSDISCIDQYVSHESNGYLLKSQDIQEIQHYIEAGLNLSFDFKNAIDHNFEIAENFTYNHYLKRVVQDVFMLQDTSNL